MQYPTTQQTLKILKDYIEKQRKNHLIPSDNLITIEKDRNLIIINCCFGSKVNETLSSLISGLISARIGSPIGVNSDAYRIIIETPTEINTTILKEIFLRTEVSIVEHLLKKILKSSQNFKWNFIKVAKKFGVIEKTADYRNIKIDRVIESYEDSVLYEEAINKTIYELDLEKTKEILKEIQSGKIEIKEDTLSPIGMAGIETGRNFVIPERVDRTILLALKKRLEEKTIYLFCFNCKKIRKSKIKELEEKIKCKFCNSVLIAVVFKEFDYKKIGIKEQKKLRKNANLIFSFGKRAVLCLSARGVGEEVAGRILSKFYESEEEFLREVLKAEVNYARTKRFWWFEKL